MVGRPPMQNKKVQQSVRCPEPGSLAPVMDGDFVATFAHEIRNALSPLNSAAELIGIPDLDEKSTRWARNVITRQVRQLLRLTNDVLDAHRLDHRQDQLELNTTDLVEIVKATYQDHRHSFALQEIKLLLEVPTKPIFVQVDVDRLGQVFNNLLNNSLKFTDRGGKVWMRVGLQDDGRQVVVAICDTGIGIEPSALDTIFVLNAREASDRNRTGLGLGLPLAKRLVELHGGRLHAHSDGKNLGSEFQIVLPTCVKTNNAATARGNLALHKS